MCLGATKENVAEGEFAGVELTFMGLNNQNLHNFLFRGFLKPWEAYTGAKINWIDLAQADYNARLQQSIATGTVDFDIVEMGAPFEGDVLGKGLASEMPDWVKDQIDMDDYVDYLKAPVGTWGGKTYRISIDGDCHTFAYRTDYFGEGGIGGAEVPTTWQEINQVSKDLVGKEDPLTGLPAHGYLDPLKGMGRLRVLFPGKPCLGLCQAPEQPGLAVRARDHEAHGQQPGLGAGHPGRDGPDRRRCLPGRSDQRRSRHHGVPAVPCRYRLDADVVGRRGFECADVRHLGCGRCRGLWCEPGFGSRLQRAKSERMGRNPQRSTQHGLHRLGRLRHGDR